MEKKFNLFNNAPINKIIQTKVDKDRKAIFHKLFIIFLSLSQLLKEILYFRTMINQIEMQIQFRQNLVKMLNTRLRIDEELKRLVNIISLSESKLKKLMESRKLQNINIDLIADSIEIQTNLIKILKITILVQRCITEGNTLGLRRIIQKLIIKCLKNCNLRCVELDKKAAQFIINRLMMPYLNYIQRRLEDQEAKKQKTRKTTVLTERDTECTRMRQLSLNFKKIQNKKLFNFQNQFFPLIQDSYVLINLLNKISVIAAPLLTIIRYYGGFYGCFHDLNISIAMDTKSIYLKLQKKISKLYNLISSQCIRTNSIDNNCSENQEEELNNGDILRALKDFRQLIKQSQKVKQLVYPIFYSNYYSLSLKLYIPSFLDTDELIERLNQIEGKLHRPNKIVIKENYHTNGYKQQKSRVKSGIVENYQIKQIQGMNLWKSSRNYYMKRHPEQYLQMIKGQRDSEKLQSTLSDSTFSLSIEKKKTKQQNRQVELKKKKRQENLSILNNLEELLKSITNIENKKP